MRSTTALIALLAGLAALGSATPVYAGGDGSTAKIIFVNPCRGGCALRKGVNNAIADESEIPQGPLGTVFQIGEFAHGDAVWAQVLECIRNAYAPFDVVVTDEDPGSVPHHEAIASGFDQDIGWNGLLGIAGAYGITCNPENNVISFSFLNMYPANAVNDMCAVVLQESSHSFGMPDHLYDCTDPLTYLPLCGRPYFRNKYMPCGEYALNDPACQCGGTRVNSHVQMLQVFGEGATAAPPTLSISRPLDGDTIVDSTSVIAAASDARGVYKVELYLNGWPWDSYTAPDSIVPPYSPPPEYLLQQPGDLPDGVIDIEVRAYNDLMSEASAMVTVTKGVPCTSADTCLAGQQCEDGRCFWDEPSGELGDDCTYAEFCRGPAIYDGECESDGERAICTRGCYVGVNDDCPDAYSCLQTNATEGTGVCWPDGEPPGCCNADAGKGRLGGQIAMICVVGALVLRRRRRR